MLLKVVVNKFDKLTLIFIDNANYDILPISFCAFLHFFLLEKTIRYY